MPILNAFAARTAALGLLAGAALCTPVFAATFTKIADFSLNPLGAAHPTGGAFPYKGVVYGTTRFGGSTNTGTVYKYTPGGGIFNQVTLLHSFYQNGSLPDVVGPQSDVAQSGSVVYGVGSSAGEFSSPGVYQFDMATGVEAPLFLWSYSVQGTQPNGVIPVGNLLYGTTSVDGTHVAGTIFAVNPNAITETVVYAFQGGADGAVPLGSLVNVDGILYGTTSQGGTLGGGTIFSFDLATGKKATLYSFDPAKDGTQPQATLIASGHELYGTTYGGGRHGDGAVFAFDKASGKLRVLHDFLGKADGQNPLSPLLYVHRLLYGTTSTGGTGGGGTVFAIDPKTREETVLHSFAGVDGAGPVGALHYGRGALYGTTYAGGNVGTGVIFEITP